MRTGALLSSALAALAIAAAAPPVLADTDAQEDSLRSRLRAIPGLSIEGLGRIPPPPDTWSMPIVRPDTSLTYYMRIARPSPGYHYHVLVPGGPNYGWSGRSTPRYRIIPPADSTADTMVEFWMPQISPEGSILPDSLRFRKE